MRLDALETLADGTIVGHIAQSQPFVLRCGGQPIEYDGWYDPSGSHLTYPPDPSLVVTPLVFVASGTADCEIELAAEAVQGKDGEEVPSDHIGPYDFGVAPLNVYATDPANGAEGVHPATPVQVSFNAPTDLTSLEGTFVLNDGTADVAVAFAYSTDDEGNVLDESLVVATRRRRWRPTRPTPSRSTPRSSTSQAVRLPNRSASAS